MDLSDTALQVMPMLPHGLWVMMYIESLSKIWAWPIAAVTCSIVLTRAIIVVRALNK